ncbi:Xaa-Arg dipeptidase [Cladobotryum mycophilum]|uniref:Peptidase M20 domain-containing protein 2 n=1 Tax=Cladobotryum mycophilum TaxID=491253 RepID=A0ABR0SSV5_9HYPO
MDSSFDDDEVDDFVIVPQSHALDNELQKPEFLDDISKTVDGLAEEFWPINKKIHDNPERGFKEVIAHDILTRFMGAQDGWSVTPSAYGMPTAWVAVYDTGKNGPVVSFNAEMDCLPAIGHACGHNLIATASVVGAVATAEVMKRYNVAGKVVLFGTPAEEGGGGKIKLLKAGAYSDHKVDVSLISHPGIFPDAALMRTASYFQFKVEYFGRETHAAANPWLGINALDALVAGYSNVALLRQQIMPSDRVQGRITNGGLAPNIIHAYTAAIFVVRSDTQKRLDELKEKVYDCFRAGALATGARVVITDRWGYQNHIPNRPMGRSYTQYFNALNPPTKVSEDPDTDLIRGEIQASTDQGDISHAMPSLSVSFSIQPGPLGQGPHNPEFAESTGTIDAYNRTLRVAKGLAGVAMDVLTTKGLLEEIKNDWRAAVG